MTPTVRAYRHRADFDAVGEFLVEVYEPGEVFANWLQPRWEYMHFHPYIDGIPLERFGVAVEDGQIVGVVHLEHSPAFTYFQVRPGCDHVKEALLDHAERNFGGYSRSLEQNVLGMFVNEFDETMTALLRERGYRQSPDFGEDQSRLLLDRPLPEVALPPGFRVQSLAVENDLRKVNAVLWRGFDHEGPPPEEEIAGRRRSQQAPHFRKDLNVVAIAPDGGYAAYAGMWVVPRNRVAYVEPVATDPAYRRMGLGRAAVVETLRRAAALGAEVAWVGSSIEFYAAIGFELMFTSRFWFQDLPG